MVFLDPENFEFVEAVYIPVGLIRKLNALAAKHQVTALPEAFCEELVALFIEQQKAARREGSEDEFDSRISDYRARILEGIRDLLYSEGLQ